MLKKKTIKYIRENIIAARTAHDEIYIFIDQNLVLVLEQSKLHKLSLTVSGKNGL